MIQCMKTSIERGYESPIPPLWYGMVWYVEHEMPEKWNNYTVRVTYKKLRTRLVPFTESNNEKQIMIH